ncbi:hypothetical protein GCM10009854_02440 [Saccharopolyspora halophila]|uniref:Uncharacterized protein n=1 Tax=Saccharopolyspora halophila TaxID=405551 RepID=A0ABP5SH19_9PSEU
MNSPKTLENATPNSREFGGRISREFGNEGWGWFVGVGRAVTWGASSSGLADRRGPVGALGGDGVPTDGSRASSGLAWAATYGTEWGRCEAPRSFGDICRMPIYLR